jgi:DNA-3-methyladenine glycosylase II
MPRISLAAAVAEVRKRDPVLNRLVARIGPIRYRPRHPNGHFGTLVHAIVFQQLAGSAARAILDRVVTAAGGTLAPESLIAVSDAKLRAAGLSQNKLLSLRDLSAKVLDGSVDLSGSLKQSDDEIVAKLVTVRGIGKWTAEMYLLFELRRLDVWPVDDLAVRQGYAIGWDLKTPPKPKDLLALGEPFRPYRSVVALYCWEAVHRFR